MKETTNRTYYILALAISVGLVFHGASFFSTLEDTYDLYVHIFFADHYSKSWFDPWESRWYTGFSLISYPPLVHQLIALLSYIFGLKFSAFLVCFCIVLLYVTGAFRFARLITVNTESAGYAALIAVFLPSVIETFHVFGQVPMMMGISWLLHSLPEAYKFIRKGKLQFFLSSISLIAVAVCSHHVTPIFGMVFFVVPLMCTAILDGAHDEVGSYKAIGIKVFIKYIKKYIGRITLFGASTVIVTILVILPYWLWSKNDPIAQIPIPHGSRDNFIDTFSSGLVFFIIPWGFLFLMFPFYLYRYFSKRNIFLGLSFVMLTILGTGGTTPIPRLLLGESAFSILTLERFTFWATIYAMPLTGEFLWRFTNGDLYQKIILRRSRAIHSMYITILIICVFFSAGFTTNLSFFRPLQPDPINLVPLKNFLESDKHYKWRYLTLGFGDQMAWLSANTRALTIDGNYHSARRVPELTSRAVERLENSKYRGTEGIETLRQFLSTPESFHLKYVFSNDRFYDPLLYFSGWHRVKSLDNGIIVWERSDVSALPTIMPRSDIPKYQKILWGVVPLSTLFLAFFFNVQIHWVNHLTGKRKVREYGNPETMRKIVEPILYQVIKYWIIIVLFLSVFLIGSIYYLNVKQLDHERVVTSYYDALDFKEFIQAHSLLSVDDGYSLDYFLLEIATTDGLLDSFGKMDRIEHKTLEKTSNYAKVSTTITWITPLKNITKSVEHEVVKQGWKWYLKPLPLSVYIPTNQFSDAAQNNFINQGRRKISTEETFHEDVLDRPVTTVRQAKLIKKEGSYHLIGLIQNLDSRPVDLTLKATLMDENGVALTSYYDQDVLIHKLLPKEVSGFRIDFKDVEWITNAPDSLRPPRSFKLEVLGAVTTQDLFKSVALNELQIAQGELSGHLYNYGSSTATVSQLVHSYFKQEELIWVDISFTEKSVFPQKSVPFSTALTVDLDKFLVVPNSAGSEVLINGLDNDQIAPKYQSNNFVGSLPKLPIGDTYTLQVNINNFVSNPSSF